MDSVNARPQPSEAPEYFTRYIDLVPDGDIRQILGAQATDTLALIDSISDARSRHRYAPDKWSIGEVVAHVNDTERVFVFRAFWFARGFDSALPSFDQNIAAAAASAEARPWNSHVDEFRLIRGATLAFFEHLPSEGWARHGEVSSHLFTVRALAYIVAGHVFHHAAVLKERYLRT
jgi:DinB superfamily